jgi:hypothetical protein
LIPFKIQLKRAKATNCEAISMVLQKLKKINAYMAVGAGEKIGIVKAYRVTVIKRRYINTLLSFIFY